MNEELPLRLEPGTGVPMATEVPASTLRRWRRRAAQGLPLLQRPGPKKSAPLPLDELHRAIEALPRCPKRNRGTGALYRRFAPAISRRELGRRVRQHRQDVLLRRRRHFASIQWEKPNIAWAIDATEYGKDAHGRPLFLIVVIDLASRFIFAPLVTVAPHGGGVAAYLQTLFARHGKPLILKRDNGSLFNNQNIHHLLAAAAVIPLNSPPYHPRYNGGIEKAIRELKLSLHRCLPRTPARWDAASLTPFVSAAAHLRNCTPRRSLRGATAAHAYTATPPARFTSRQRHQTFFWIKDRAAAILSVISHPRRHHAAAAWRKAAELFLQTRRHITVHPKKNTHNHQPVSPQFHPLSCS